MSLSADYASMNVGFQSLDKPVAVVGVSRSLAPASTQPRWSSKVATDVAGLLEFAGIAIMALVAQTMAPQGPFAASSLGLAMPTTGLLMAGLITTLYTRQRLYEETDGGDLPLRPLAMLWANVFAFALMFGIGAAFGIDLPAALPWAAAWFVLNCGSQLTIRVLCRLAIRRYASLGKFKSNLAVIGSGPIAERLAQYLKSSSKSTRLVGVFDDRGSERTGAFKHEPALGGVEDLIAACRAGQIDRIIIALPAAASGRIEQIAGKLEQLPVTLQVCSHIASDLISRESRHAVSNLGPIGLIDIKHRPLGHWGRIIKRAEDFVLAGLLAPFLLPVFALIGLAIKLDSRGPVFFRQRRHGFNEQTFSVFKFRTMRVMEDGAVVTQATKGDPRVTRVGRLLRATSLDELPQVLNVLTGDMSLVGPRPHALAHDDHWSQLLAQYAGRQQVKPGITGWAQINGLRGEIDTPDKMRTRVEHDLFYIDHWSLWLDLKIMLLTPIFGLVHKNAY